MKNYYIGIDPGVSTGLAIWDAYNEKWEGIFTLNIIKSMEKVLKYHNKETLIEVVCEDARLVRYKTDPIKAQGAGSIKRDCKVWEEFFVHHKIEHQFVRPKKAITKIDAKVFKMITKYDKQTSNHARDACMLVFKKHIK